MKKTIIALMACAACASVQAAVTGWAGSGGDVKDANGDLVVPSGTKVLYIGTATNGNGACDRTGIGEVTESNGNTVVSSVTVKDYDANLTSFRISADKGENQVATITTLNALDNSTITIGISGWNNNNFKNLTIDNLNVNNGSIIVDNNQTLTLNKLTGSLDSVTVYGNLTLTEKVIGLNNFTLGTDATLSGIYNLGQKFSGGVTFTLLDASDDVAACLASLDVYERTLYDSTMWNAELIKSATLNIEGYENGGLVYLKDGKYYTEITKGAGNYLYGAGESITLDHNKAYIVANVGNYNVNKFSAVVIPEPTTATLSLLALAGLAMRRRRR